MFAVLALQTLGLTLDVTGLLASTLFGKHANPIYLLLEAALVHVATVLLFAAWYAAIDHHRQVARARGEATRQRFGFPQQSARYPGYEEWVPGFVDYLTFAFTTSSSLGPAEALPLAKPAKLLVTLQVSLSLVILLVLAARAIGLIGEWGAPTWPPPPPDARKRPGTAVALHDRPIRSQALSRQLAQLALTSAVGPGRLGPDVTASPRSAAQP